MLLFFAFNCCFWLKERGGAKEREGEGERYAALFKPCSVCEERVFVRETQTEEEERERKVCETERERERESVRMLAIRRYVLEPVAAKDDDRWRSSISRVYRGKAEQSGERSFYATRSECLSV